MPQAYSAISMITNKVITAMIGIDHLSKEMNPP
jgi:hypothetical protein